MAIFADVQFYLCLRRVRGDGRGGVSKSQKMYRRNIRMIPKSVSTDNYDSSMGLN